MDAFRNPEPVVSQNRDGEAALEQCFVDIPDCLETTNERQGPSSREVDTIMDVDSLLQPDYSGFTFWSSDSHAPAETKGAAEIWRTGAGILLPAASSDQTFLSSFTRRVSEESLHTTLDNRCTPFKSGYFESESELFPGQADQRESMLFIPSTVSTADGCQRLRKEAEKPLEKVSKRKRQSVSASLSPPRLKMLKSKASEDKFEIRKGLAPSGRWSKQRGSKKEELSAVSEASPKDDPGFETPTSRASNIHVAARVRAGTAGDGTLKAGGISVRESVLTQSSPNLPARMTTKRVQKPSERALSEISEKLPKKTTKKMIAATDKVESKTRSAASEEPGPSVIEKGADTTTAKPSKGGRRGKIVKRLVSTPIA